MRNVKGWLVEARRVLNMKLLPRGNGRGSCAADDFRVDRLLNPGFEFELPILLGQYSVSED
jgi:hypothetical protein